jgi:hypothetical protein
MTLPRLSGFALLMVSASSSFFGFVSVGWRFSLFFLEALLYFVILPAPICFHTRWLTWYFLEIFDHGQISTRIAFVAESITQSVDGRKVYFSYLLSLLSYTICY